MEPKTNWSMNKKEKDVKDCGQGGILNRDGPCTSLKFFIFLFLLTQHLIK